MHDRDLVAAHIGALTPYAPGPPPAALQEELGLERLIRLDSNENPLGPSPKAVAAIGRAAIDVHRYPDGGSSRLKRGLATHLGVSEASLVLGNGSNELIELLMTTFASEGSEVLTSRGSFIAYHLAAQARGLCLRETDLTEQLGYDLEAMLDMVTPATRLIFIANPNNPTGTYLGGQELEDFITALDQKTQGHPPVLVLDEAYREYVDQPAPLDSIAMLGRRPRTVVLRTFSKAYGLAGLRCGYAVTTPELARHLDRVRAPFNVSMVAQEAALAALGDEDYLQASVTLNRRNRSWLSTELRRRGFTVTPSQTNFVLVDFGGQAGEVYEGLRARGVLTRPMRAYGLPTYLRIGVGLVEEQAELLSALDALLYPCNGG
ncbi:MAG: histidinol-phosphate transaminase [Myxococcota bacterium]